MSTQLSTQHRGVLGGPQLVREASCGGVRACLARGDERGKESAQQARAAVTTLTHKSATGNTPPLASPETVQYCLQQYRDVSSRWTRSRVLGLDWLKPSRPGWL